MGKEEAMQVYVWMNLNSSIKFWHKHRYVLFILYFILSILLSTFAQFLHPNRPEYHGPEQAKCLVNRNLLKFIHLISFCGFTLLYFCSLFNIPARSCATLIASWFSPGIVYFNSMYVAYFLPHTG
jgi:hypothetical protein